MARILLALIPLRLDRRIVALPHTGQLISAILLNAAFKLPSIL
jgi:hypothetical protein